MPEKGPGDDWARDWDHYHQQAARDTIRMPDLAGSRPGSNGGRGGGSGSGCGAALAGLLLTVAALEVNCERTRS